MDGWGTSQHTRLQKQRPWGRGVGRAPRELETHGHRQTGFCFQDFAALFFCLFGPFCLILGMASPADLFLIRHHLWVSRGGPQPCSFGSSPGNNSDSVQGPLCKILTYGRIFLQIFILLWYCSGCSFPQAFCLYHNYVKVYRTIQASLGKLIKRIKTVTMGLILSAK